MNIRKKGSLIWIISMSCIVLGILIALISLLIVGFDLNRLNTDGEWQERTLVQSAEGFSEINIEVRNRSIEVRPGRGDEIVITYFENDRTTFTETITNSSISFVQDRNITIFNMQWFTFNLSNVTGASTVVVEIPEEVILSGDFRTTNGRIAIGEVDFEGLQVISSNGSISLEDAAVMGQVTVNTSNAAVNITNSDFSGLVGLETSNGRINLEGVNVDGNLNLRTSSGNVNLSDVNSTGNITTRTSNGRIELERVITTGDLDLTSSNGMIQLGQSVFNNGSITTTNGRVTVNHLQDHESYRITTRTSNATTTIGDMRLASGNNSIGNGERLLDIRTSNGHIEVNFD